MQIEYRNVKLLKKNPSNPRYIKEKDFMILCKSIKDNPDYFEARPIILSNRTGELVIIAGNQRYEAAIKEGLKKVPTFLIENLTEVREREIVIRDNVSNGEFDWDLLANEWNMEELVNWGIEELPEIPEIIEIEDYKLSQNPNDVYGGNSIIIRVGDFMSYIKKNKEITDYLIIFVSKFELEDEKLAQQKRNEAGLKILELIKENEDSIL